MLVLSRKVGESIRIGDAITVVVNRISGNRVTLGIEAPRRMKIIRGELRPFEDAPEPSDEKSLGSCRHAPPVQEATLTLHIAPDTPSFLARRAR